MRPDIHSYPMYDRRCECLGLYVRFRARCCRTSLAGRRMASRPDSISHLRMAGTRGLQEREKLRSFVFRFKCWSSGQQTTYVHMGVHLWPVCVQHILLDYVRCIQFHGMKQQLITNFSVCQYLSSFAHPRLCAPTTQLWPNLPVASATDQADDLESGRTYSCVPPLASEL